MAAKLVCRCQPQSQQRTSEEEVRVRNERAKGASSIKIVREEHTYLAEASGLIINVNYTHTHTHSKLMHALVALPFDIIAAVFLSFCRCLFSFVALSLSLSLVSGTVFPGSFSFCRFDKFTTSSTLYFGIGFQFAVDCIIHKHAAHAQTSEILSKY